MAITTARRRATFRCVACGADAPKWTGRCDGCGEWNTVEEEPAPRAAGVAEGLPAVAPARPLGEVPLEDDPAAATGVGELDRVLGGGLVPGSVTLLGGAPGVGKSTILLQAASGLAAGGREVLYVAAEESAAQVRRRAVRLGAGCDAIRLTAETSLPAILAHVVATEAAVVVVDSIQAVHDPAVGSAPGSVSQVRHVTHCLTEVAKSSNRAVLLVGHVTKDGNLAGPRVVEHVVDTVLSFEGERDLPLRTLRALKHRFGPTGEVGIMAMAGTGLEAVPDPSSVFLADRRPGLAGSVVVPITEGRRPVLVEVQALVGATRSPQARRSVHGLDPGRVGMALAVLERRAGLPLAGVDVYALAVGGARALDPGVDLGVAVAVASSATGVSLPADLVACAEVGLGGELRRVGGVESRLAEAARVGFRRAVVAASTPPIDAGLDVLRVDTLDAALAACGVGAGSAAPPGSRPLH